LLPAPKTRFTGLNDVVKLAVDVVADNVTVPENPLRLAAVTAAVVDELGAIVAEEGLTPTAKSGTGVPIMLIEFRIISTRYTSSPILPAGRLEINMVINGAPSRYAVRLPAEYVARAA